MHPPEKNSQFGAPLPQAPVDWSSGLCDCTDDCKSCCLTFWCPCITFGRISEIVDESPSCRTNGVLYTLIMFLGGLHLQRLYSCTYRSKMRHRYNLKDHSSCGDCLLHCLCEPCALCQEYRELQNRGFDMKIGWQGNVERQKPGIAMAHPVVHEGMTR